MSDRAHDKTDKLLAELEKRLEEIYEQAGRNAESRAATYFKKFAELDAKKAALVADGKLSREEYIRWRENKILYGEHWKRLKNDLALDYLSTNRTALDYLNGIIPQVYTLNYNYSVGDIARQVSDLGGAYHFELTDAHTVKNLAVSDKTLLPYKYVDGSKDVRWNTQKVNSAVLQGILAGDSVPNLAKRLRTVTEMNRTSSIRNARTTVTGAECKGRQDSYERAEADGIRLRREWMAAIDGRTRHAHRLLDGQLADTDKPFKSELGDIMYPGDPHADPSNVYNCRCTIVARVVSIGGVKINQEETLQFEPKRDIIYTEFYDGESANEFFYYDDEKRGLMAKKNSTYGKWKNGLLEDQQEALYSYTADGFGNVNDYLRKANGWETINAERVKDQIKQIDSAISSFDLKQNIVVQRGAAESSLDVLFENSGGINELSELIGHKYHDDGFMSSTVLIGNSVATTKPVVFDISIPAGRGRGAYINEFGSQFKDAEYEFLIKRGATFTVTDIKEDVDLGKIYVKMVMDVE